MNDRNNELSNEVGEQQERSGFTKGVLDGFKDGFAPDFLAKNKGATNSLKASEAGAVKNGLNKVSSLGQGEKSLGGLYKGSGKDVASASKKTIAGGDKSAEGGKGKSFIGKFGALIAIAVVGSLVIGLVIVAAPVMIFLIDMNLQCNLGFCDTSATLEKQAEYITKEEAENGEVAAAYAEALASQGIEVGQVTAKGEFVRTNTYIADIDELDEVAATGSYYVRGDDGELVFLFDDQIIKAGDFVAAVESNPKMYAAYSEALDISARYYYSDDVDQVYKDMGLSRGAFSSWKETANQEENKKNFDETLEKILNNDSTLVVNGCEDDKCEKNFSKEVSGEDDAGAVVDAVASETKGSNSSDATNKAAQLLNSAISSGEPYRAASAFMAVEEPIQRARIDGDGPVSELMNTLNMSSEVTYTDIETGEEVTKRNSIMNTRNFTAAASGGPYSKSEAANFSRDRVLKVTDSENESIIGDTTVATKWRSKSNIVLNTGNNEQADVDVLSKATDSVSMAMVESNSDQFSSVVGGNRIVEGGSFLSNTINSHVIGAMPSDEATIAKYHHEVEEIIARRAEADRATLSPFDISSKHTFLGSLVYGIASVMLKGSNSTVPSVASKVASLTGNSVAQLLGDVIADGNEDEFTTMAGNCNTVKEAANVEGDLYCTAHNTISTDYMSYTKEDWVSAGIGVDDSGIIKDGDMAQFVALGMDREVTVGVKSSDVCERWKDFNQGILEDIGDALANVVGLYQSCNGVSTEVSNGQSYTLSDANGDKEKVEKYSGYALYDTVSSLIDEKKSSVALFKEEYYKEHPKDDSAAGVIARRSGMSKNEAQIALNYASYLNKIAKYNASERYVFGGSMFEMKKPDLLIEHSDAMQVSLYCVWGGKTEFADVRNRSFAV